MKTEVNNQFSTLSEAYEDLKNRGFKDKFEMHGDREELTNSDGETFEADQVKITEFHRFEGNSNPSDMSVIYAIETKNGYKGTLIDNYGAEASRRLGGFLKKVDDRSK